MFTNISLKHEIGIWKKIKSIPVAINKNFLSKVKVTNGPTFRKSNFIRNVGMRPPESTADILKMNKALPAKKF